MTLKWESEAKLAALKVHEALVGTKTLFGFGFLQRNETNVCQNSTSRWSFTDVFGAEEV